MAKSAILSVPLLAAILGCGTPATPTVTPATGGGDVPTTASDPATVPQGNILVSLPEVGLEATALNRSVSPCDDFYEFACGGWHTKNEIPADKSRYGRFTEVDDRNEALLKKIFDGLLSEKGQQAPYRTQLAKFYRSCMDTDAIEAAGLSGIAPLLEQARGVKNRADVVAAITAFHAVGINVGFGVEPEADFKDATQNILFIDSAGLGLPDRDYYLQKDHAAKLTAYREHLVRLFGLLGNDPKTAARRAKDVITIETALARVTKTRVERRDVAALYNPHDNAALKQLTPKFDWSAYFAARGNPGIVKSSVTSPNYFKALDKMLSSTKAPAWSSYLQAHLVQDMSMSLPKAFDDEAFSLRQALTGQESQPERYKRCIDATTEAMSDSVSRPFVEQAFGGDSKDGAIAMIDNINAAFADGLAKLEWMTPETRKQAQVKLKTMSRLIGYPDKWKTYDYPVDEKNFAANALAGARLEASRQFEKAGKPTDRSEWMMPAHIVNAYYNPLANNMAFPAGILQPPFFGKDRSVAANLGGLGMVVGHEITHGFDDMGAKFGADGNMNNWWQPADEEKFVAKGQCLADQYDTFEPLPGEHVNGKLTLGENIADLGGMKLAFYAYRRMREGATARYIADGFNEDQQFFLAAGQAWCSMARDEEAKRLLVVDPHSPSKFRVNGSMRNLPEFAEAFQCEPATFMSPTDRCEVW